MHSKRLFGETSSFSCDSLVYCCCEWFCGLIAVFSLGEFFIHCFHHRSLVSLIGYQYSWLWSCSDMTLYIVPRWTSPEIKIVRKKIRRWIPPSRLSHTVVSIDHSLWKWCSRQLFLKYNWKHLLTMTRLWKGDPENLFYDRCSEMRFSPYKINFPFDKVIISQFFLLRCAARIVHIQQKIVSMIYNTISMLFCLLLSLYNTI